MDNKLKRNIQKAFEAPRPNRQEKIRFLRTLPQPRISMFRFILVQASYMRKMTLVFSVLLLLPAVIGANYISENTLWIVSAFVPILGLLACAFTGFCVSMLWPGTLILMEEKVPNVGVAAYALMAAGGDLGASIAPQMLGIIVDKVSLSKWAGELSATYDLAVEQIGMKTGMLVAAVFPVVGLLLLIYMKGYFRKREKAKGER